MLASLLDLGHEAFGIEDCRKASAELEDSHWDAAAVDWDAGKAIGLNAFLKRWPRIRIILVAEDGNHLQDSPPCLEQVFSHAVDPARPITLWHALSWAESARNTEARLAELEARATAEFSDIPPTIGIALMPGVMEIALAAASTEANILLIGEAGTGKDALARAIHRSSRRSEGALITISCPSLDGSTKWQSMIAASIGGTLLLRLAGALPIELQGDLLDQLGSLRIISTVENDSGTAGLLPELRRRLNTICLTLPPLRERTSSLEELAMVQLDLANATLGKKVTGFSPAALEAIRRYGWPGNLRELRAVILRAAILATAERIEARHLAPILDSSDPFRIGGPVTLQWLKNEHIRRVIRATRSLREAAVVLGVDPATLYRKRQQTKKGPGGRPSLVKKH